MKTIFKLIIVSALLFIFNSCEQDVLEIDLDYQERLVVRSMLEAGKPIEVSFSRTLPLDLPFDSAAAVIENAAGTITRGDRVDTLEYIGGGVYRAASLIAGNGEEYKLNAEWNGKSVYAETQIPFTTTFQNGRILSDTTDGVISYYIQGFLTPRAGAVYGATWAIIDAVTNTYIEDNIISELHREQDKDIQNKLTLKTRNIPPELLEQWRTKFYIRINAFDEEFYNFFLTQDANAATNNIFSQSGVNLRWNVEGDGIGMFIGKSDYLIKVF